MRKVNNIRALTIIVGAFVLPGAAQAASLLEIYQQALQSDPQIHEAEARRLAALEAGPQARGAYLPQLSFGGQYATTERDGPDVIIDPVSEQPVAVTATTENDVLSWSFNLRQTLFRWDQIVNLRRADKLIAKAEAVRESAQQDLIVRVAQRYFDVLAAEDRLTSIHADRTAIARQLEQAKQRFEVGLIAITDVQESQAAYDQSIADEIAAKRSLATSREFLREITGEYVPALSAPGDDFPLIAPDPNDEVSWVDLSMSQNLNLIASRLDEQLARDEISFRRNGYYPTIELVANTGEQDTDTTYTAPGITFSDSFKNTSDSISVQFNLPIFAGGSTSSRVREAVYLHRASREQLQRVTRETERQARDAYLGVISERSRVKALEQAVASSRTALQATEAGFEVGTRTIVDVLNSQFSLYLAITNFYQSRYNYVLNALRLKQAAGTLEVQDLERIDRWLTERKPPEQAIAEEAAADGAGY
ncbi:MAG: TolC family outer membrane protein [Gammaproteobacteria bacterium]|nr:TolC family outer membrane protein [Gammaproteobacteria bacterium]NND48109.1 TolC family outer membrane protein [Woeseiaceae bacterium]NNL45849.1 TolC family outer membrane protein [Woeseiaceae bacterium]